MRKILFFSFLGFFFCTQSNSQTIFTGVVKDSLTNEPIPFVSIAYENTSRGTVTNAQGEFRCSIDTTQSRFILFSCIGYDKLRVPASRTSLACLRMKPATVQLQEVVVLAGKRSWVIDLFVEAVKQSRRNKTTREAKSFLSLETMVDQTDPLEVMEAFYQCTSAPRKGVSGFELKNGRFGLSRTKDLWFINKNPTEVVQKLYLFEGISTTLPNSPLSMNVKEMKKHFRFRMDTLVSSGSSAIAVVRFFPRENFTELFSGRVFIDTATFQIKQVEISCQRSKNHPFHPIDPSHTISNVSLDFVVKFKEIAPGQVVHDFIRFKYELEYKTARQTYAISSNCFLLFYDFDDHFVLPYFIGSPEANDYGKILSMPYNPTFWKRNYIIPVTQSSLDKTNYFLQNGLCVNYKESTTLNSILPQPKLYWSPEIRLDWSKIKKENPGWIVFAESKKKKKSTDEVISTNYFLDYQVFLDFNPEHDTCYWQSKSMLFLNNSFYGVSRDSLALKALELEFDITELYRLRLEHRLDSALAYECNPSTVLRIYDKLVKDFDGMRWLYRKEVKRGQNQLAYETWRKRIDLRLKRASEVIRK
jgi:hypothetical protein